MEAEGRRSRTPTRARFLILAGVVTGLVILGGRLGFPVPTAAEREGRPAAVGAIGRSEVHAQARLEPAGGVVTVGVRPGLRVEKVLVAEGDAVAAGAALAVLEGYTQRQKQLSLAEAERTGAGFRSRVRRDELKLERERFDRLTPSRLEGLKAVVGALKESPPAGETKDADGGAAGVPAFARRFAAGQTRIELAKAERDLKELETGLDLLGRQRALEDEQVADDSPVRAVLDRQVDLARAALEESEVRAPVAGRVLGVVARAGEVSAGPLLYLGDVGTMDARAEVFESEAPDVEVGAAAVVTVLGTKVAGKVIRVGKVVGRNRVTSLDPTALADRRVVDVLVRLGDPALASRLVNMQVEVAIRRGAAVAGSGAR